MTDTNFWDRAARKYSKSPISNMDAYEKTLERVRTHLKTTDKALELGCGTGSTALLLAPSVGDYTAADISPAMIEIANEKLKADPQDGLSFIVSDAQASSQEPASFDVVLGFNLYHLVRRRDDAMRRARDLLKPGGLFITKTPCLGKKWYLRPVISVMQLFGRAPFVEFLNIDAYDAMIKNAGFEIIETGLYPPSAPSRFVVARRQD